MMRQFDVWSLSCIVLEKSLTLETQSRDWISSSPDIQEKNTKHIIIIIINIQLHLFGVWSLYR